MRNRATILRRGRRSVRRILAVVSAILLVAILGRPAAFALAAEGATQPNSALAGELERSLGAEIAVEPLAVEVKAGFDEERQDEGCKFIWTAADAAAASAPCGAPSRFDRGIVRPPPFAVLARLTTGPPASQR